VVVHNAEVVALLLALTTLFKSRETSPFPVPSDASATLHEIVATGELAELSWPNFSDYQARVMTFYESSADAPAWIQSGASTPQALSMIEVLQQADNKGLHAEDYDGPRWADRLARMRQFSYAAEARFDAALTICVMRYVSDLHIGRLDPGHLTLGYLCK